MKYTKEDAVKRIESARESSLDPRRHTFEYVVELRKQIENWLRVVKAREQLYIAKRFKD